MSRIPREFAYVESSPGREVTLWLVDLSGATAPVAVARWTYGGDTSAVSADGKTVIIAAPGERSLFALHLLRPLTGEATVLFEGPPDGRVFYPRLSPDGRRYAFILQRANGSDGIFAGAVSGGPPRQLVPAPDPGSPPVPYGWSDDGQWLAFYAEGVGPQQSCCTYLRNVVDGGRIDLGSAQVFSWRSREPRLAAASLGGKGHQGAFGATVYTFDLAQQRRTDLFSIDPLVRSLSWHPTRDEFLYVEDATACPYRGIYALARGDGQDAVVVDASTGRRIATIPNDVRTFAPDCP